MKRHQIEKWFYDNNLLIREENDFSKIKFLTFFACCFLELNEKFIIEDSVIKDEVEFEDYSFTEEELFNLNCLNRHFGYSKIYDDFKKIRIIPMDILFYEKGTNVNLTYKEIAPYFDQMKEKLNILYKEYNFNTKIYRNNYNTFLIHFDRELTSEEKEELDNIHEKYQAIDVTLDEDNKLVMD